MWRSSLAVIAAAACLAGAFARASGPRWVTGQPYYYPPGNPVVWYIDRPSYFTDPGDLSPYVNHAAADALVAAAAGVWTIPTSRFVLSYGGALAEHISSVNVSFGSSGLVFPADVQKSNYAAIPIAVLYDSNGSITDLMLGSGASNPSNCRHAGVTESVDSINASGQIQHAILVLNGRCTGPAPEQQLQLQYQLMRAFGRVIGIGWSQTNDNVFTGSPTPTYNQALYWPIMHPIDIICGLYTYQCLPQPFTLRPDDTASLGLLYPVWIFAPSAPGKTDTLARANRLQGHVTFPNGQGMQGVNVVVHRLQPSWWPPEDWEVASGVTGFLFRRDAGGPVTGPAPVSTMNMGTADPQQEGYYDIFGIPIAFDWEAWQDLEVTTQPVNPLYIGPYAVGPYDAGSVSPSGTSPVEWADVMGSYADFTLDFSIPGAIGSCNSLADGTEPAPAALNAQGWWNGTLCGYGHSAWSSISMKAQRSATLEVTALDEQGFATQSKAMPVLGLWNATDPTGTLPTVSSTDSAFNGIASGMTSLAIALASQSQHLRMVIADQRGDGRPDFAFQARLLYADSISPTTVPASGGTVVITGTGFSASNVVTINGVTTQVANWAPTSITAVAPTLHDLHSLSGLTADIAVKDLASGGSSTMTAALIYAAQPSLNLVSSPSGLVFTGVVAATAFTVQAVAADGVTPIAGEAVTFSSIAGEAQFGACGASSCVVLTDSSGNALTTVTPLSPGTITLSAASAAGTQTVQVTSVSRRQSISAVAPIEYIAAGAHVSWTPVVSLSDNAGPTVGVDVQWQGTPGIVLNPSVSLSDAQSASTSALAGPLTGGTEATFTACAWISVCTTFTTIGVDPSQWQLEIVSGGAQSLTASQTFVPVVLRVTDAASHPIAGATVQIDQTLEPWGTPCPSRGRCPISPVYGSSSSTLTSDSIGFVTVTPLEAAGQAEVTNIAVAAGTQGFISFTVQKQP